MWRSPEQEARRAGKDRGELKCDLRTIPSVISGFHILRFFISSLWGFQVSISGSSLGQWDEERMQQVVRVAFIFPLFFWISFISVSGIRKKKIFYTSPLCPIFFFLDEVFPFPSTLSPNRFFPPLCSYISLENTKLNQGWNCKEDMELGLDND